MTLDELNQYDGKLFDYKSIRKFSEEYGIDERIPLNYIRLFFEPCDYYHSNLICGSGKTIGLAIATVCSSDRFNYVYCASTHERLKEFHDLLIKLGKYGNIFHITESTQILNSSIRKSRVILMTTSMIKQMPPMELSNFMTKDDYTQRVLILDELPEIINGISMNFNTAVSYDRSTSSVSNEFLNQFIMFPYMENLYKKLLLDYEQGNIIVDNDLAINKIKNTFTEESKVLDFGSKMYYVYLFYNYFCPEFPRGVDFDFLTIRKYRTTVRETYLERFKKALILDATADLYSEILETTEFELGEKIGYDKYINKVVSLNNHKEIISDYLLKNNRVTELEVLLNKILDTINETEGPKYVVTNNSAIYNEDDSIRNNLLEFLKSKYEFVIKDTNKNFILCTSILPNEITISDYKSINQFDFDLKNYEPIEGDLMIANYNRNRGTNKFRKCRSVFLLGEFYLPRKPLKELIKQQGYSINEDELMKNLSVADAIQEISRGCLRSRNENSKENIYLLGSEDWINGICNHLGVGGFEMIHDYSDNPVVEKLLLWKRDNLSNREKLSSYYKLCDLILKDNEEFGNPAGKVYKSEIDRLIKAGELPSRWIYWNLLKEAFDKIGFENPDDVIIW